MSRYRGRYVAAGPCLSGPQPGNRALMAWYLGAYGDRGATNLGIYNCKPIEGTSPPVNSLHGEGRADDFGSPLGNSWALGLAEWLRDHSAEIGIQLLIYRRQYWSCTHPDDDWRLYGGVNPHTDHMHVELTWDAAVNLTVPRINAAAVVAGPPPTAGRGLVVSLGAGSDVYEYAATYGDIPRGMAILRSLNPGLDDDLRWDFPPGTVRHPYVIQGRQFNT